MGSPQAVCLCMFVKMVCKCRDVSAREGDWVLEASSK